MFKEFGKKITRMGNKLIFKAKKNSPELLLGAGIVGIIGTVVLASKETLTADEILKHHQSKLIDIQEAKEMVEDDPDSYEYDDELVQNDKRVLKVKTVGSLVKNYAPAITLGAVSIGCILASKNIMQKRYLGVVTAYNGLSEVFQLYRQRVIEDQGKEKDLEYRYGQKFKKEVTEIINEDGSKEIVETYKPEGPLDPKNLKGNGAIIFDSNNKNWQENFNLSIMFLRAQENVATDLLHSKGHLFLNDVYDLLGIDDTTEGAVLGWLDNDGDGYVSFGIDGLTNPQKNIGDEYEIVLDFNHDGVMYDRL